MDLKKIVALALVAALAAGCLSLVACSSEKGAWDVLGVDKDDITDVTIVSSAGVLRRLDAAERADFIAEFDALQVSAFEGLPDPHYVWAIRVTLDGEDGRFEYKLDGQLTWQDGMDGGCVPGYYRFAEEDGARLAETMRQLFYKFRIAR